MQRRNLLWSVAGFWAERTIPLRRPLNFRMQKRVQFGIPCRPQEQLKVFEEMEKDSMEMMAIYHSHTHTIPFPSETDVKLAFYPEISSIIISLKEKDPVVKAFRIGKEAIYLEEIEVIP